MTSRLIISRQVMISNIALPGLLTSNNEMLVAIYINTPRDCKTSEWVLSRKDYHSVTAAYLCLDKTIRHG